MKDQLISKNTAILAKEKGFNIPQYSHYRSSHDEVWYTVGGHARNWNKEEGKYLAPTQSLLQRWLREKKGIQIYLIPNILSSREDDYLYSVITTNNGIRQQFSQPNSPFMKYEDALEIGLKHALNLIQ